jgi:hypothetical protein
VCEAVAGARQKRMTNDLNEKLITAARGWKGDSPTGAMLTATRAFLAAVGDEPALITQITAALGDYEPGAAAWIAVTCGTAVERGAPAEFGGPAIFALLRTWLTKLPDITEESAPPPTVPQAALLVLFRYLSQSVVTHVARLPLEREALGRDVGLTARLGELAHYSHGAIWIREALLKSSGALVFLHPASGAGLRMRYSNVSNCFHLFSLLQTAIGENIEGGRAPSAAIARVARGKSTEPVEDEAWWHYGTAQSKQADLSTSIWGEGLVSEIPRVDRTPLVLAFTPILETRTWDAAFLGPHLEALPADIAVDSALTPDEVRAWLARIGFKPRRTWWRRLTS